MGPIRDITKPLLTMLALTIPLSLWKLAEIVLWLVTHIRISVH